MFTSLKQEIQLESLDEDEYWLVSDGTEPKIGPLFVKVNDFGQATKKHKEHKGDF